MTSHLIFTIKSRFYVLLFSLFISSAALCEASKSTYVVGVGGYEYLPYYTSGKGDYIGYARDLIDLWAEVEGINVVYRPLPWKRLVAEVNKGDIDFVFPDNPVWSGELKSLKKFYYSLPVVKYVEGTVVKKESLNFNEDSIDRIGTIRGFTALPYLERIASGKVKLVEASDVSQLLKQVMIGRIDGAYLEKSVVHHYAREMGVVTN